MARGGACGRDHTAGSSVTGDPAEETPKSAEFDNLVERLQVFWADDAEEYEHLVLRLRRRKAQRSPRGRHLIGHTYATQGRAPRGHSNSMRNGRHSARLAPLMRALGRESRTVVEQAIARAIDDALWAATFRFVHHQRLEASGRA